MKILAFTDKNYEYQVDYLLQSLHLHGHDNIEFLYYTVGFESDSSVSQSDKKTLAIRS